MGAHHRVNAQLAAFRSGVEDVMAVDALSRFSELELQRLLCGHQQVVWTAYLGAGDWLGGTRFVLKHVKRT